MKKITSNSFQFICMLGDNLAKEGCHVHHAIEDADTLIAAKAIESSSSTCTVVIGEDIDLFAFLSHKDI